jgi:two-component system invasion response regulator UvrY
MIRILVVDNHELVRVGLRSIISQYPALKIAGEARDGQTAIRLNRELRPDVVLTAVRLPGLSGIEVTARLKQMSPGVGIIAFTFQDQSPFPAKLMEAGASGYLTKGCSATELVEAIKTVARGGRHIGSSVAQKMALDLMPGQNGTPFDGLSAREMEVMLMLAEGKKVQDIAHILHLSPKTIATYKYRIYDKLNTQSDVQVTRMAMRYGVVALG